LQSFFFCLCVLCGPCFLCGALWWCVCHGGSVFGAGVELLVKVRVQCSPLFTCSTPLYQSILVPSPPSSSIIIYQENTMPLKVIDWNQALEQVGGDEEFLLEVLRDLLEEALSAQERIADFIDAENFEKVMHEAHKIKGSASYLACDELKDISLQLQDDGRAGMNGTGGNDAQLWKEIKAKFNIYKEALKDLRKEAASRK
jgi:HPt (histidine-containing phosphotransfer) domain-containing protein